MAESTEEKKTTSRKFVVWIVWGIITLVTIVIGVISVIKGNSGTVTDLIEKVLGYFFGVSMLYLGVNVGQKVGLALTEKKKEEDKNE